MAGESSVDVVIPCYQYGRFLRDCVTSVLTQGIQNLRVLIIDNASTDDSVEVAQQLAGEDRRVEVVAHRRNLGPHASFNEGIDWAKSHYFMILCADDLLAPSCLPRAVSIMEQHPASASLMDARSGSSAGSDAHIRSEAEDPHGGSCLAAIFSRVSVAMA